VISAFGVEDPRISKADQSERPKWHNTRWEPTAKERAQGPEPKPARNPNAYVPGTITLHHEQAQLHGRKKAAADRRISTGSSIVGAGLGGGAVIAGNARRIARAVTPSEAGIGTGDHALQLARNTHRIRLGGAGAGLAVAGGGAALAAEGAVSRIRHGRAQNKSAQAAQAARRARAADKDWSA
jgi:hypothetical protein